MSFWAGERRHRDVGLDPEPVEPEHARRASSRRSGAISRYGVIPITADQDTPGPDGAHRRRRRHHARRAWKARRPTRTTRRRRSARRRRAATTRSSCNRDGARRARASASRARSSTTASTPPARTQPRGGLNDAQSEGRWTRRSPCSRRRARSIVDPADIPSVVDTDRGEQLPELERRAAAWTTRRGSDARLLDRVQVRHEARLQRLAQVARRQGAGEDADRAARSGTSRTSARARSSTARRTSTSRTRWTSQADRARYEADRAEGHPCSRRRTASTRR